MKTIVCTVTNDLVYDQRMIRICTSLAHAGYDVLLIGRKKKKSPPLQNMPFRQKRIHCFFEKGKAFYAEYNIRLYFYLLFCKAHLLCAIDLDTILPVYFISVLRNKKRVFDAHELFCEMEEIIARPRIYRVWKKIEQYCVPKFKNGITIGDAYAQEFYKMYGVSYTVVRNATVLKPLPEKKMTTEKYILYQGAVNEGRCFETLIPAMQNVDAKLIICGEGNFYSQAQALVKQYRLENKIEFKGYIAPTSLKEYTMNAYIGLTLFSHTGKSNYLSMGNRFFDYMHAGIPQICVAYPEYIKANEMFEMAVLIEHTDAETIAEAINSVFHNKELHNKLHKNALKAREYYCWQNEEKKLLEFYTHIFES